MASTKIPPLLGPYLSSFSQSNSLILVTSVLNASANWLVLRFVAAALQSPEVGIDAQSATPATKVVLVSFLRDWEFWRSEGRRLVSLHLAGVFDKRLPRRSGADDSFRDLTCRE